METITFTYCGLIERTSTTKAGSWVNGFTIKTDTGNLCPLTMRESRYYAKQLGKKAIFSY